MLRIALVALVLWSGSAFAEELSKGDIQDQEKRLDARSIATYDRLVDSRDVFAWLHDYVHHPAYDAMTAARTSYDAAHQELDKQLAANNIPKATAMLDVLQTRGDELDDKVGAYHASSSDGVQKIQIVLGVLAFMICGIAVWLVKRRKR
jgi:hypothetical protein